MSSTKLLCASAEQIPSCQGCKIAGLTDMRLRSDVADVGGMVLDNLYPIVNEGQIEVSGYDAYRAFGRVIEGDTEVIDAFDAEFALIAAQRAFKNEDCISA